MNRLAVEARRLLAAHERATGYLVAVVSVLLAAVVALVASGTLHAAITFFPFLLAVAVAAVIGGVGPGVLATALAALVSDVALRGSLGLPSTSAQPEQVALALFIVEGVAISGLGQLVRRGREAVERNASEHRTLLAAEREARDVAEHAIARAEGLQATAAALGRALGTVEVADVAVREGLARLGAGKGVVGLLEPDGHTIRTVSPHGFAMDIESEWPTYDVGDAVPLAEAVRLREPVILRTAEEIRERYPSVAGHTSPGGPAVVVPLLYEDRAIGGMYFRYASPSSAAESDQAYLAALGRQCASAFERARLYEAEAAAWAETERARKRIEFLATVGDTLAEAPTMAEALTRITQLAVPEVADWAVIFLHDPGGAIRPVAIHHRDPERVAEVEAYVADHPPQLTDRAGTGAVIASGTVELVIDHPTHVERLGVDEGAVRLLRSSGVRSVMTCPLIGDSVVFGSLTLATTGERRFGEADGTFGDELGRRVGSALDKVRLNAQLGDRLRGQEAVAHLGQLALLHHELEPLFDAAARELADVLDADITAIMQHVPDRRALRIVAGTGWRNGVVGHALISDSAESQAGFALISDGPVVSSDYAAEDRFRPSTVLADHGARCGVTTPILGPSGPWGVLGVHSRSLAHFDPDQVALLDTFANVLGSAVSRREVEVALRDRDDRLELALAASRTGFWEWNGKTGRILWSDEICRLHGLPPGTELESLDAYLELVHPDDRAWVRERIEQAREAGAYDARFRIILPDGNVRWTQSTAKVFFDRGHRAIRMIGVGRDVTEEVELEAERTRMAEAELRASELGQAFIGVVSHELRTPITSIFGGSKLLRRLDGHDSEQRAELTANIEAEAERLYRLTEDLLVLTRVERGGLDVGLEPVALARVLERVTASERAQWPLTTIELVVQPGLPIALGDDTYIEQLVRNLVGNAAKYAPESGIVQVVASATQATESEPAVLEVRVLDRGPGLAEADLDHLFELFYRSPLVEKKAPGAGIGLFVCNQLARAMGGRLWARNRDGGGSEFGFSLRVYAADEIALEPVTLRADGTFTTKAPGRSSERAGSPATGAASRA